MKNFISGFKQLVTKEAMHVISNMLIGMTAFVFMLGCILFLIFATANENVGHENVGQRGMALS